MHRAECSRRLVGAAIAGAVLSGGASPGAAQEHRSFASVLSYQTVKVADGIYAFITPEERSGFQAGNSVAVIGDDGVLIVDSGNLPVTRRQIAELRKLTDKPVRYLVNTHWHPDHNLGNAEYRAAFSEHRHCEYNRDTDEHGGADARLLRPDAELRADGHAAAQIAG
ncbi:MAG: MBL fold metallo-hydrolase [Gemmatimonadota bacterium]|nr:MBL fold metallo-hydrolase [Gemmatimonadota bacterium]